RLQVRAADWPTVGPVRALRPRSSGAGTLRTFSAHSQPTDDPYQLTETNRLAALSRAWILTSGPRGGAISIGCWWPATSPRASGRRTLSLRPPALGTWWSSRRFR